MTPRPDGADVTAAPAPAAGGEHGAPLRLHTRSAADTRALGAALAGALHPGDIVLLAGDLGAGKTTLVQGVASGLGITEQVTSPTFTLVRHYRCPVATPGEAGSVRTLLHADLYRLERLDEVADLAIGEMVEDAAVAVVEWGDVGGPVLGRDALPVRLDPGPGEHDRDVVVTPTPSWAARRRLLETLLAGWTR